MKPLTTNNLLLLQNIQPQTNSKQTINQFIHSQQNHQPQPKQHQIEYHQDKINLLPPQPQPSSSSSIPLKPRVAYHSKLTKPTIVDRHHSSNLSSIINRSQLLKSRAKNRNKNKRKIDNQTKNYDKNDPKHTQSQSRSPPISLVERDGLNGKTRKKRKQNQSLKKRKNNTLSSSIKRLPDSLVNDARKRKKSRLTIERYRVPGIFRNTISGSAARRTASIGDLTFNQLGFLDKSNPKTKHTKNYPLSYLPPRVQPTSIVSDRPHATQSIKSQPIPPSEPPRERRSSISSSVSNLPSNSNQHLAEIKHKKKAHQEGTKDSDHSIPQSRRHPPSENSTSYHTSAHSAYSLMVRKAKVAKRLPDHSSTLESGKNSIPTAPTPKDRQIDQFAKRPSSLSHQQRENNRPSEHHDYQTDLQDADPDSGPGQQDFHEEISDSRINPSIIYSHHHHKQQSFNNRNIPPTDWPPGPPNQSRDISNHFSTRPHDSISFYSTLNDHSVGDQENVYGVESWDGDDRLDDQVSISERAQVGTSNHVNKFYDDHHSHCHCYRSSPSSNPSWSIPTELDPSIAFGNPNYQSRLRDRYDPGRLNCDSKEEEHEIEFKDFDEDKWSIEQPTGVITGTGIDEYVNDDDGPRWSSNDDVVNQGEESWEADDLHLGSNYENHHHWAFISQAPLVVSQQGEADRDEIFFDDQGRVLEDDDDDEIFSDPRHRTESNSSVLINHLGDEMFQEEQGIAEEEDRIISNYPLDCNYHYLPVNNSDDEDYRFAQSTGNHTILFSEISDDYLQDSFIDYE